MDCVHSGDGSLVTEHFLRALSTSTRPRPPHTQDFIAFVAERARVLQETRRAYWQRQPGAPGLPGYILTPFQFEIRYMVHHAAHWLYQYTWFGAETLQRRGDLVGGFGINQLGAAGVLGSFADLLQVSRGAEAWGGVWQVEGALQGRCVRPVPTTLPFLHTHTHAMRADELVTPRAPR